MGLPAIPHSGPDPAAALEDTGGPAAQHELRSPFFFFFFFFALRPSQSRLAEGNDGRSWTQAR